jgi:cysteine desulfurase
MIYFDNASTTELDAEVKKVMIDTLENIYGNPSSKYYPQAIEAQKILDEARKNVAVLLGGSPDEIIFNSGASEGNNHVIKGIAFETKGHIITSKTEHSSSIKACEQLKELGYDVTFLDVNQYGQVKVEDIKENITDSTRLISLIWANNEIGTKNDILAISKFCKKVNANRSEDEKIYLHVDATQLIGKEKIDLDQIEIHFLTFSAHKLYGPKGVGVLYIREDEFGCLPYIKALISGSQEEENRGGTYSVHNIAGLSKAVGLMNKNVSEYSKKLWELEGYLIRNLKELNVIYNGYLKEEKVPGIVSIQLPNVNNEIFIKENAKKVAISTGSACSTTKPSHVLNAIGLDKSQIRNSIRISLGKYNTKEEINNFIKILENYL